MPLSKGVPVTTPQGVLNRERAIYLAAVSQTLGAAQFGYFGGKSLELLLQSQGLPDSLLVVLVCSAVYVVFTLAGYFVLSERFTRRH